MKTVTIGGNRLGSGKKMRQTMKGYERSTHDLSKNLKTTISPGTLVPFWNQIGLPDDTFDIELNADIITSPTVGPMFDSFKVQLDVFEIPMRLYIALLHNNALNIGRLMSQVKIPQFTLTTQANATAGTLQVNPSSIVSYLGINGIGRKRTGDTGSWIRRNFNALGLLSYWDIYKTYYANKQEEDGVVIHTPIVAIKPVTDVWIAGGIHGAGHVILEAPSSALNFVVPDSGITLSVNFAGDYEQGRNIIINTELGAIFPEDVFEELAFSANSAIYSKPKRIFTIFNWAYATETNGATIVPRLEKFPLTNIDEMRDALLTTTGQITINDNSEAPYNYICQFDSTYRPTAQFTQEGLGIKCYQSDKFNNWIDTEWIDGDNGVNAVSAIAVIDDKITIDQMNIANKVYNLLNRIAISDGSYKAWIETVYDTEFYMLCTSPMYVGGLSKELIFQKIVSNSASDAQGQQPLGTYASIGRMGEKHKGGKISIKCHEPSYLMGIISITPRIIYSQGNQWYTNLKTIDDLHKPELDEIGFQDLITDQMSAWDTQVQTETNPYTAQILFESAGKQPAWINYMTDYDEAKGNFAIKDNMMFMTLNRNYTINGEGITDVTTYIDPSKYNYIFADPSLDAMNFWAEIDVKCTARRKMSAKQIPNL